MHGRTGTRGISSASASRRSSRLRHRHVRRENARLAGFVLFFGEHTRLFQAKVLAHFVAQMLGAGLAPRSDGRAQVSDEELTEAPQRAQAPEVSSQLEHLRVPMNAAQ